MSRLAPGVARLTAIAISLVVLSLVVMALSFLDRPNGLAYAVLSVVVLIAVLAVAGRSIYLQRRSTPTK